MNFLPKSADDALNRNELRVTENKIRISASCNILSNKHVRLKFKPNR
jgi:hypothetical protein